MKNEDTSFPQYRRLVNGKAFYKIINDRRFEEIQFIGSKKQVYSIQAKQYPEMLKIQDMINCHEGIYVVISEEEYDIF